MNDVGVIDRFLEVFGLYIDSGFGLLGGEVAWLSATLIVAIDMTLAGLFWAMGGDEVLSSKLLRKVLYVGALPSSSATSIPWPGSVFNSFAGWAWWRLVRTDVRPSFYSRDDWLAVGIDAGRPIMLRSSSSRRLS